MGGVCWACLLCGAAEPTPVYLWLAALTDSAPRPLEGQACVGFWSLTDWLVLSMQGWLPPSCPVAQSPTQAGAEHLALLALCLPFAGSVQISGSLHRPVGAALATQGIAENRSINTNDLWAESICHEICAPRNSYGHSCHSYKSPRRPNTQAVNSHWTPPYTQTLK